MNNQTIKKQFLFVITLCSTLSVTHMQAIEQMRGHHRNKRDETSEQNIRIAAQASAQRLRLLKRAIFGSQATFGIVGLIAASFYAGKNMGNAATKLIYPRGATTLKQSKQFIKHVLYGSALLGASIVSLAICGKSIENFMQA